MENRSRVQEIRQKFENASSHTNILNVSKRPIKPPLAIKPTHLTNNNYNNNNKVEQTTKCIIKRSHAFRSDKSKIKTFTTPKQPNCDNKQLNTINIDKTQIINNPNKLKNTIIKPKITESLRVALKAPLPSGPPPIKPPRTFAHQSKMNIDGKLKNSSLINLENDNQRNVNIALQQKQTEKSSKDKFLLNIKNFENVIEKKSDSVNNNNINNNNNNGHIYDCPHESSSDNSHLYSQPFAAVVPDQKPNHSPKKINSLHYMSTPIEDIPLENDESSRLEYLIVPLNKESVEGRKEFDTVLRKTRKLLISNQDNDEFEETYDGNSDAPLADYCAMLPPTSKEHSKNHDVFDEIKSLMIEAYNNGCVKFDNGDGEQTQFRALKEEANSKQLTEMISQIIKDGDSGFRDRRRIFRAKSIPSEKLIDALLLIGLDTEIDNGTKVPYVKMKYTQPNIDIPFKLERLVFPDVGCWPPINPTPYGASNSRQFNYYTVILTQNTGERSFAYCRRLMPEGSLFCLPLTYVILTGNDDAVFYHEVLNLIEINHGLPVNEYNKFITSLLNCHFPKPTESLTLDDVQIKRNEDNRPYEYVISILLNDLSVPVFLKLFSAMLLERKIIIISKDVSKVCDSIEALCKCLYPFSWQHTIVSVLPSDMLEMLQSPPPYLIGLLKGNINLNTDEVDLFRGIDNCFIVDVDNGNIIKSLGDEITILPKRLIKTLKSSLYLCPVKGPDIYPSTTLLKLFIELVGHYPLVIINSPATGPYKPGFRVFLRNSFVSALSSKSTENFLRLFIDTAMFESFIHERLDNLDFKMGLFEKSCIEFIAEEVRKPSGLLKTITLNRTVKILGDHFLKEESIGK